MLVGDSLFDYLMDADDERARVERIRTRGLGMVSDPSISTEGQQSDKMSTTASQGSSDEFLVTPSTESAHSGNTARHLRSSRRTRPPPQQSASDSSKYRVYRPRVGIISHKSMPNILAGGDGGDSIHEESEDENPWLDEALRAPGNSAGLEIVDATAVMMDEAEADSDLSETLHGNNGADGGADCEDKDSSLLTPHANTDSESDGPPSDYDYEA